MKIIRSAKKSDTVAVLDLGTSKTACFIGHKDAHFGFRLLGAGIAESAGVKNGAVIDLAAAEDGIRAAVAKAERDAGVVVQSVSVNVSTRSLRSQHLTVQTAFASGEVADRDLKRVVNSSLAELAQADYAILHALPLTWSVDEERGIRDPRGMFGQTLGVDMHFVLAGVGPLRNLAHCVERSHLRISSVTVSPYAAGLAVLTDDERDLGATIIDMGGGITTAAVFRDNALIHVEAISVGGRNVTTDLARGLTTPFEAAERIKRIYGSALHGSDDDRYVVPCPPMGAQDELHEQPRTLVTSIVRSRIEETLEILKDRLAEAGLDQYSGRRIVLTGGGAQLNGVRELAEYVFNKRTRIGHPHGILGLDETFAGPDFAVGLGLIKHAFMESDEAITGPPDLSGRRYRKRRYAGGGFGRSLHWLKENF